MPVQFHVLFHVLALGGSKPTEGECIRPHIIMVARGGRRSDDPNFVLRVLPQVCDFSDSDMPDSEAATVPLVFPGETPGQRELEHFLEQARPRLLRGHAGYLHQGATPPEWNALAPQAAVPESDAERPGPPTTAGGPPGPPVVDLAMLRKIQSENRKIAKDNLANAAALAAAETNAKTALARDLALALKSTAPALLNRLQRKHQIAGMPTGVCDGVAMFKVQRVARPIQLRGALDRYERLRGEESSRVRFM